MSEQPSDVLLGAITVVGTPAGRVKLYTAISPLLGYVPAEDEQTAIFVPSLEATTEPRPCPGTGMPIGYAVVLGAPPWEPGVTNSSPGREFPPSVGSHQSVPLQCGIAAM